MPQHPDRQRGAGHPGLCPGRAGGGSPHPGHVADELPRAALRAGKLARTSYGHTPEHIAAVNKLVMEALGGFKDKLANAQAHPTTKKQRAGNDPMQIDHEVGPPSHPEHV